MKLQNIICNNVEKLEKEYGSNAKFKRNKWKHGEFRTVKGEVIEKGGVAFIGLWSKFDPKGKPAQPLTKEALSYLKIQLAKLPKDNAAKFASEKIKENLDEEQLEQHKSLLNELDEAIRKRL